MGGNKDEGRLLMKIYGEKNIKRSIKIGEIDYNEFNDKTSAIGFIKEHGMLGEYMSKMYDEVEEEVNIDADPKNVTMHHIDYAGNRYWYGENAYDEFMLTNMYRKIGVYREMPDIYDDKKFHWKPNKKYGSMECKIEDGVFEYHCIYKADGNATVNVKYCACDNYHRNKVTIATIEVEYATNEVIMKGIMQWKREFKNSLKTA